MTFTAVLLLTLGLLPASGALGQGAGDRFQGARYELRGPLELVVFGAPSGERGVTRIVAGLRRGELRSVLVPFDGRPMAGAPSVLQLLPSTAKGKLDGADERVQFIEFVDSAQQGGHGALLPPGLLARSRPPVEAPVGSLRVLDLVWLLACSGAVFSLRRRPFLALAIGIAGAAGTLGLRRMFPAALPSGVTVIEADLLSGAALRVDGAFGALRLFEDQMPLRVTTRPRGAQLDWTLELSDGGRSSSACRVSGSVCVVSQLGAGPELDLARGANDWVSFADVWTRSAAGDWASHGAWPHGAPLPLPSSGAGMPPGWLASGLPPGRGVLIGRLAVDPLDTPATRPLDPGAAVWLRAAGFE